MSVTHWPAESTETMVVDVTLRDETARIRWRPGGTLEGDQAVIDRLQHLPMDTTDPVAVLTAVRRNFGEHVHVHFED